MYRPKHASRRQRFNRRRAKFSLERFLFRAKWNWLHIVVTVIFFSWVTAHGYEDVRTIFQNVAFARGPAAVCQTLASSP